MTIFTSVPALRRMYCLLLLAFLGCYPLAQAMPVAWGWENGIVENAQAGVLLAGALAAALAWRRLRPGPAAILACCVVPVWLLLAGRELSWGAVFFPPLGFGPEGPIYASRVLWYRPLVPPFAAALVLGVLYVAWRHGSGRLLWNLVATRRFPWGAIAILAAVACASTASEGHLRPFEKFMFEQAESFEELVELVGYLALFVAQWAVFRELVMRAAPAPARPAAQAAIPAVEAVEASIR